VTFWKDRGELMTKTMESLLVRSAKMRDLCTKVEATGKADQRPPSTYMCMSRNLHNDK